MKPYSFHSTKDTAPPEGPVLMVRNGGAQDQVTIRNGVAYQWRYADTEEVFCQASEITEWRGCGGFDF